MLVAEYINVESKSRTHSNVDICGVRLKKHATAHLASLVKTVIAAPLS